MPKAQIVLIALTAAIAAPLSTTAPKTRTDHVTETIHGVTISDPYRWLEDQQSPETRAWIDEQNTYTRSVLDPLPGRAAISRRLEELLKTDRFGTPVVRGGRYFVMRRLAGQNQYTISLRNGLHGSDEVLIDPNKSGGDQTTSVNIEDVSEDGKWLLYATRQGGEDEVAVTILDVDANKEIDHLPRALYWGVRLTPDKRDLYYSKRLTEGSRIYHHAIGKETAADEEIFGKGTGATESVGMDISRSGRYLGLYIGHGWGKKTEVYVKDLRANGPIATVVNDIDADFTCEFAGDRLYAQTNWNAPNGRIFAIDLAEPARENWREVVPEAKSVIENFSVTGGRLAVNYLENVNSHVKILDTAGKHIRDISFPSLGTVTALAGRWESSEAFYVFTSFAQPATIYRYDVANGKQETWARVKAPIDPEQFEVKQVWYPSKDKTHIPMFLVYKKGLKPDGNRPTLLTGYGGFLNNETPAFRTDAVTFAEHGGVFALPNLRGGGEFGEKWHRAGMLENKQNVFDDFIGAAEWLMENGYTKPSHLAIAGGSNGGLLVGAAITQRPDLFQAVACEYPLLDMIRYQKFLLGKLWTPEYGSADDAKQFEMLYKYSPYQHVQKGVKYPAVLFVTGDSDTRVAPLHARKMTALMQASTGSDRPILLRYDTKAGHSAGLPVSKQVEELTDIFGFLLAEVGGV
ncbi:MAG: Prolyl oligopeptidase [Bryobacterales bacterium]|nr:Prolyl oligopeptidase [Bryobacterales bacterium]